MREDLLPGVATRDVMRMFFGVLGPLVVVIVVLAIFGGDVVTNPALYVAKDYLYVAVIGAGIYLFGIRTGATRADFGLRRCAFHWLVGAALLGILLFAAHLLSDAIYRTIGVTGLLLEPRRSDGIILVTGTSKSLAIAASVSIIVLTPIAVELFVRGILFSWLRRNLDFFLSALASSIIFGVIHIEIVRYGQVVVFGLFAAWVYERTNSLWPVIVLHIVVNAAYWLSLN